jgi:hypothetical protein
MQEGKPVQHVEATARSGWYDTCTIHNLLYPLHHHKMSMSCAGRSRNSNPSASLASAAIGKTSILAKSQQRTSGEALPQSPEEPPEPPEPPCAFTTAGNMLGKKRKFGGGAAAGGNAADGTGQCGTGKKRLGMSSARHGFNPPFRGRGDAAQSGQQGDVGAAGRKQQQGVSRTRSALSLILMRYVALPLCLYTYCII